MYLQFITKVRAQKIRRRREGEEWDGPQNYADNNLMGVNSKPKWSPLKTFTSVHANLE